LSIPVLLQTVFPPVLLRTAPKMYVQDILLVTSVQNSPTLTPRSTVISWLANNYVKVKKYPAPSPSPPFRKMNFLLSFHQNQNRTLFGPKWIPCIHFTPHIKPVLILSSHLRLHLLIILFLQINYSLPSMDTALISSIRATCFTNSNFFFTLLLQYLPINRPNTDTIYVISSYLFYYISLLLLQLLVSSPSLTL